MNWQKLQKQIVREATANPKKAACLGLLCVVCLYFWAPLVWGWIEGRSGGGDKNMRDNRAPIAANAPTSTTAVTGQPVEQATEGLNWQTVDALLEADERMDSAKLPSSARNPFRLEAPVPVNERPVIVSQPSPAELGLELSSTFLGSRRQVALINGRAYRVGQSFRVGGQRFRLDEIAAEHVVLTGSNGSFVLTIESSRDNTDTPQQVPSSAAE